MKAELSKHRDGFCSSPVACVQSQEQPEDNWKHAN